LPKGIPAIEVDTIAIAVGRESSFYNNISARIIAADATRELKSFSGHRTISTSASAGSQS
jgi:hypothetical protein